MALIDELEGVFGYLIIDGFHALAGEGTGIFDLLTTVAICPAVEYPSGAEPLLEFRVLRIVYVFRLLLGIEVVEIAEELVEAVHRWQELVFISKMVLAELTIRVTQRLQQFGDSWVLRPDTDVRSRHANLRQASTDRILTGDERGAPSRTTLLAVIIGESRSFIADAVDVGSPIPHLPSVVVADVPPADVITPKDKNVRLTCVWHLNLRSMLFLDCAYCGVLVATCKSLSTLNTPGTKFALIPAMARSASESTTPVKVTFPFFTMMWMA